METRTPYEEMNPESGCRRACKCMGKFVGATLCLAALLVCMLQGILYWWATMKCNARHLEGYAYPGGGPEDLVPNDSLLVEQEPRRWGWSFINIPADKSGLPSGASTGVYFRTWGPLWNTYVYQDVAGQETFVVRDRPLALGGSHKIMRCDGTGPVYVVSEGDHVFVNAIRSWFGMYTSRVYNIWKDNELVANSEKLGGDQSQKQVIYKRPGDPNPFASCFLKDRHYHGKFDEWFMQVDKKNSSVLPAFVPNAACTLMAFVTAEEKAEAEAEAKEHDHDPKVLLEAVDAAPSAAAASLRGGPPPPLDLAAGSGPPAEGAEGALGGPGAEEPAATEQAGADASRSLDAVV